MPRPKKQLSPSKRKTVDAVSATIDATFRSRKPGRAQPEKVQDQAKTTRVTRGLGASFGRAATETAKTPQGRTKSDVDSMPQIAQEKGKKRDVKLKPRNTSKQSGIELSKESACTTQGSRPRRVPVEMVELDDQTFSVGDCAYVVLNDGALDGLSDDEEEDCAVCGKVELNGSEMLECGRCLRGFHLCCLDPPLSTVPEDEWVCPDCDAGKQVVPSSATTARGKVLADSGLGLARIEALWEVRGKSQNENSRSKRGARRSVKKEEEEKEYAVTLRWFCIPEQTHVGRQPHHAAREVFLTNTRDINDVGTLLRHAYIFPGPEFWRAPVELGDDVFLCDYEYDEAWQRFKRRSEFGASDSEEDQAEDTAWEPAAALLELSSEEEDDENPAVRSKSVNALWAEKGLVPPKNLRGYGSVSARPRKQGGEDLMGVVGRSAKETEHSAVAAARRSANVLTLARDMLAPHAAPRRLPCREKERAVVEGFVRGVLEDTGVGGKSKGRRVRAAINDQDDDDEEEKKNDDGAQEEVQDDAPNISGGRCLYISGIPGTGKTATVREVMRSARQRAESGDLPSFWFVEINGLRLPSPQHAYCALLEALTGERLGPASAAAALEAMFGGAEACSVRKDGPGRKKKEKNAGPPRRPIIVLLDELDLLVNRSQTVLYNLFDWPTRSGSRLSIIGIANTMDLPERLHPRIGSRLAGRRLAFQPYNRDQLETILRARLEGCEAFESNALVFVSRKVANCSGDIRLALEICARATEIAELEGHEMEQSKKESSGGPTRVTMQHVDRGIRAALSSDAAQRVSQCTPLERLLLAAVHLEARFSGRAEMILDAVATRLRCILSMAPNAKTASDTIWSGPGSVLRAVHSLAVQRLLLCDAPSKRLRARVTLNVPAPELLYVLTSDDSLQWLSPLLGTATA